ncbi:unnamed protein product [Gongylonema pulchrum]|uniref:PPM-type phosphatase domain-containing protein n=1 Tax=Gongylonema pulchrum TaxID=637853 RepID=A0A183EU92_9BILA|nr:unnamed protein product [Gongylonema pulchrum]
MASILCLNPKAELARHAAALELNVSGAKGLMEVMRTNLGPKGTMKMYVHALLDLSQPAQITTAVLCTASATCTSAGVVLFVHNVGDCQVYGQHGNN